MASFKCAACDGFGTVRKVIDGIEWKSICQQCAGHGFLPTAPFDEVFVLLEIERIDEHGLLNESQRHRLLELCRKLMSDHWTPESAESPVGAQSLGSIYLPMDNDGFPDGTRFADGRGTFIKHVTITPFGRTNYWEKIG